MAAGTDEIDLQQLIRTVWRGKWLVVIFALIFGALGFFYATKMASPVYNSVATVSIDNRESQATDLDALVGGLSAEQPSLNTEMLLIRSRQLLSRLVQSEDLLSEPEFNPLLAEINPYSIAGVRAYFFGPPEVRTYTQEELTRIAVDRLRTRLSVTNPRQSFVFEIGISSGTPQNATRIVNALAETYINDQVLFKEEQSQQAIEFLSSRTSELQTQLNEAELGVKDFAASIELISAETLVAKNRQVKELRDRLNTLEALIAQRELAAARYDTFDLDTATQADVILLDSTLLSRLFDTVEDSPTALAQFASEFEREGSRAQAELAQAQQQQTSLSAAVLTLEQEVETESRDLLTLQQLQREAEATAEIYGYFLTRLKEAEVQQGTQQADARLLSAAVMPLGASSPRVFFILVFSLIIGALIATGIVLVREFSKGGIRTAGDLQAQTKFPVFGQLPLAAIKRRNKLVPFLKAKSNTPFSEAVRNLRTSVLLSNPKQEPCVILLTSSVPAEGKTTTSISLAHSLVGMGKSVLLIEGDIRKNTLQLYFETATKAKTDVIEVSDISLESQKIEILELGFDVIMGAKVNANAADYFSSDVFKKLLADARKQYDHVIIDAPPILPVADARIIGRHVDSILYVVGWDDTRIELVKAGLEEFTNSDLAPAGLILTKIDGKKARGYGGAARYGTYYGDYSKGYYS